MNLMLSYQLLEGGLVQVALQGEVAEGFPRWLVGLHLHGIPLHGVLVSDGTACHQSCARQALQILQEERKTLQTLARINILMFIQMNARRFLGFFGIMRKLKANFCAQEDKEMQESHVEVICENALWIYMSLKNSLKSNYAAAGLLHLSSK